MTGTLPLGTYQLIVYAWSTIEQTFNQAQSLPITVASSAPVIGLDTPAAGATVGASFTVGGWAIDQGAPSGTGIDAVHAYAVANSGTGAMTFLGVAPNTGARPDVGAYYGSPFTNSGYTMTTGGLAAGTYRLDVYVHSTVSGQWSVYSRLFTVQ